MELTTLCQFNAAPGDEGALRKALMEAARPLCDSLRIDRMGNVIAFKKGRVGGKKLLVSAAMDELGFLILDATADGLLQFRPVGDIDPRMVVSKYVRIGEKNVPGVIGAMATHLQTAEDRKRILTWDHLYMDIGAKSRDEALADCPAGSYAYFDQTCEPFGQGCWVTKAPGRAAIQTLLRLMENAYDADVTFAFVTEHLVGQRGAIGAAFASDADTAIVLDVCPAWDLGDVPPVCQGSRLGSGVVLSMLGNRVLSDRALYRDLSALADARNIRWQPMQGSSGEHDADAYQIGREGKRVGVLCVPCRYLPGPSAVFCEADAEAQYQLTKAFIESRE